MTSTLLQQFLTEECTAHVRRLLEDALDARSPPFKRFEFNRFEVTIQREDGAVLLEDVLDPTEAGVVRIPLAEFVAALGRCSS